jgi:hypothetical protein
MIDLGITLWKLNKVDYPQGNDWDIIQKSFRRKIERRQHDIIVGEEIQLSHFIK